MADVHDFEPIIAHRFEWGDSLANAIDQNFAAAAGNGAEAGFSEVGNDCFERKVEDFAEVDEFARAETVNINRWEFLMNVI